MHAFLLKATCSYMKSLFVCVPVVGSLPFLLLKGLCGLGQNIQQADSGPTYPRSRKVLLPPTPWFFFVIVRLQACRLVLRMRRARQVFGWGAMSPRCFYVPIFRRIIHLSRLRGCGNPDTSLSRLVRGTLRHPHRLRHRRRW